MLGVNGKSEVILFLSLFSGCNVYGVLEKVRLIFPSLFIGSIFSPFRENIPFRLRKVIVSVAPTSVGALHRGVASPVACEAVAGVIFEPHDVKDVQNF